MKHPRLALVAIAFVLAALVLTTGGCELDEVKEYQDPMTLIEVEKGEEFAIVLESNPTTGYSWELAEPLDEEIILLVKTEFEEPDVELLGASGEEKWTFKAEGLGDTSVTLAYVRPWEEEDEEAPLMEEDESETEGEEETEEAAEAEETSEAEEIAIDEEGPTTVTFNVRVKKAGSTDKEPEEYVGEEVSEPIEVEVGLEFAIVLESNPTTGYSWQLAEPLDEEIVELVKTEFEEKKPEGEEEEEPLGAPGEEVWTFEAIGEGSTEIELEYVRPWETDAAPEETMTFEVEVKPAGEEEAEE
ncbi:MAG: protease inhibitor I42 family protein [Actinobacteria bacterium]|nr:protease inhibitor I42 family protein [Actinomycetota bacterium]